MENFARSSIAAAFAIFSLLNVNAETVGSNCGFAMELSSELVLNKDPNTQGVRCSYTAVNTEPSPFINSVIVSSWAELNTARVNGEPRREIGFFRPSNKASVVYKGRRSYSDARNAYEQRVKTKSTRNQRTIEGRSLKVVRSELEVKWLKAVDATTQDETVERFSCIDAAVLSESAVAVVNWCLPKGDSSIAGLEKSVQSLRID